MKVLILIVVILGLIFSSNYPGIEKCVETCEKNSSEKCGDGEECEVSVLRVNECIVSKCEDLEELEAQDKCSKECVQQFGHEAVIEYNTCVDDCIDNGDKDEVAALQKEQIQGDPEYIELLQEWKKIIEDGEIDGEYLQSFLNTYEGGLLKDLLPTDKQDLQNDEFQSQQNQQQQQQEQQNNESKQKREDL